MKKTKELSPNYKWVIFIICFFLCFFCLGYCSSSKGIFLGAVTDALDIKRSVYSVSDTFRFAATAITNLFFGAVFSKLGSKKMIIFGTVLLIIAMIINAVSGNVLLFYLSGFLMGIGLSWTSTTLVGAVVRQWESKNIGKIMGFILCANGIGAAAATQMLSPIIDSDKSAFTYRNAYFLIALLLIVLLVIVCIFYKNAPKKPVGAENTKKENKKDAWEGVETKTALKSPSFFIMSVYLFVMGVVLQGIVGSYAAHFKDTFKNSGSAGLAFAAAAISIHAISLTLSKFLAGFLYDKFGLCFTATLCNVIAVVALVSMTFISDSPTGKALTLICAVISAICLPLETIMIPLFANDFYGLKAYNNMLGIFMAVASVGMAIGIPVMNISYDLTGSYDTAYYISAMLMAVCTVLFIVAYGCSKKLRTGKENSL